MKPGDLLKLILKDGAISVETGLFLEQSDKIGWSDFFINGKKITINILDYNFEVINELDT